MEMVEAAGLEVEGVSVSKSIKIRIKDKAGKRRTITAPLTPSCHRANQNFRASMRRIASGLAP